MSVDPFEMDGFDPGRLLSEQAREGSRADADELGRRTEAAVDQRRPS